MTEKPAAKPGRRQRKAPAASGRRNRSQEVYDAAVEVFYEKGFAAASVQDLADRVGVLKGSVYHYISSKDDLLTQIFDGAHSHAVRIMDEVMALNAPPLERLHEWFERHLRWQLEHVEEATIFFREWRFLTGDRRRVVLRRRDSYESFIRELIEACQDAGDVSRGLNLKYAVFFLLGGVNAVPEWYRRTGPDTPSRIATAYADMAVGLLTGTRPTKD